MTTKLTQTLLIALFTLNSVAEAKPDLSIQCFSRDRGGSFVLNSTGVQRNGAEAQISEIQEPFFMSGVWLWLESFELGKIVTHTTYKTMGNGSLVISEGLLIGRGGCGRGNCKGNAKLISALLTTSQGLEFEYDCNAINP